MDSTSGSIRMNPDLLEEGENTSSEGSVDEGEEFSELEKARKQHGSSENEEEDAQEFEGENSAKKNAQEMLNQVINRFDVQLGLFLGLMAFAIAFLAGMFSDNGFFKIFLVSLLGGIIFFTVGFFAVFISNRIDPKLTEQQIGGLGTSDDETGANFDYTDDEEVDPYNASGSGLSGVDFEKAQSGDISDFDQYDSKLMASAIKTKLSEEN